MPPVEDARFAARRLLQASTHGTVRIVAHPSGDGVAAAAILARALARADRSFHVGFERPDEAQGDPEAGEGDVHVFLGLGAPPVLERLRLTGPAFLVDAVPGPWPREAQGIVAYNPVQSGEPAAAACASTAAFALALAQEEANWDLAPLAFAGAIAAGRHRPAFTGWTEAARAEAVRRGVLSEASRFNLDDDALLELMAWPPALLAPLGQGYPGAEAFLHEHRLPPDATVHELDEAGRQRLGSSLVLRLLRAGQNAADTARLVAPQLLEPLTGLPLARVASWLDAAAREGEGGLALAYALGDSSSRAEIETVEQRARRRRREILRNVDAAGPRPLDGLAALGVEDVADSAPLATFLAERGRLAEPVLAVHAFTGPDARVSLRRTRGSTGPDLAALTARAAADAGGHGGGRPEAAGARIPRARLDAFLAAVAAGMKVAA